MRLWQVRGKDGVGAKMDHMELEREKGEGGRPSPFLGETCCSPPRHWQPLNEWHP